MKIAVVTGVTGQDGSYLSELLLSKGYRVIGIIRRSSVNTTERIQHILTNPMFELVEGDITDSASVSGIISKYMPDEVYNLAAQSHVGTSFAQPVYSILCNTIGPLNWLEAIRQIKPNTKYYQASTSEMFGDTHETPQNENTKLHGDSPYAIAKIAAHNFVDLYRKSYGIFACAGILFNHESSRRGENFVTRKITKYIAKLIKAKQDGRTIEKLKLGNLDAKRDWGHAREYVYGMWLMLQQDQPDDYVLATNKTRTIRDLLDIAFGLVSLNWHDYVEADQSCLRPSDVNLLCGDATKARTKLGWESRIDFKSMIKEMVLNDLDEAGIVYQNNASSGIYFSESGVS